MVLKGFGLFSAHYKHHTQIHWQAAGKGRAKKLSHLSKKLWLLLSWVRQVLYSVSSMWSPTAMADLMLWSWKKTLPPSSGHAILMSSLDIPSNSCPVSTPKLITVLTTHNTAFVAMTRILITSWAQANCDKKWCCSIFTPYILEKPLYSNQALTSAGLDIMLRGGGECMSWDKRTSIPVILLPSLLTAGASSTLEEQNYNFLRARGIFRIHFRSSAALTRSVCSHLVILHWPSSIHRLQNILRHITFFLADITNYPPLLGLVHHL